MNITPTNTVRDFLLSQIRTYVPSGVGAALSWLALRGVEVTSDQRLALVTFGTAAATGGYYTVARLVESKWPTIGGWLLGTSKSSGAPSYSSPTGGGAGDNAPDNDSTEDAK